MDDTALFSFNNIRSYLRLLMLVSVCVFATLFVRPPRPLSLSLSYRNIKLKILVKLLSYMQTLLTIIVMTSQFKCRYMTKNVYNVVCIMPIYV